MKTKLHRLFIALALASLPFLVPPASAQDLGITNDATLGVSVYWPVADAAWSLLWTPDLTAPSPWQAYPDAPSLSGDANYLVVNVAALEATNPYAFFQLISNAVIVPAAPSVVTSPDYFTCYLNKSMSGTVQPNGLDTTYWFQWGPVGGSDTSTAADVVAGTNTNPVTVVVTVAGLATGTQYHYQLYASNADGIVSGGDSTFITAGLPGAVTIGYTNLTTTSVTLLGRANPQGSANGLAGKFQWGLTSSYGSNTPEFYVALPNYDEVDESYTLTGLQTNQTYHYRIEVFNCSGTSVGVDGQFTTLIPVNPTPPSATTLVATGVSATCATLNGTLNAHGSSTLAQFEWGTNNTGNTAYTSGTFGLGYFSDSSTHTFNQPICGLTPNTTYHYLIESGGGPGGNVNGGDQTFTTSNAPPAAPLIRIEQPPLITATSAVLAASINPNGSPTWGELFYGTDPNFEIPLAAAQFVDSDNNYHGESFTISSGLAPSTTYHYHVVATNDSGGTTISPDNVFTTGAAQTPPYAKTWAASGITSNSAVLNGLVNPNGGPANSTRFFQWGTSVPYGQPNVGQTGVGNGTAMLGEIFPLTGLTPFTTYHYQIVAYNVGGTNYGGDTNFTTALVGSTAGMALVPAGPFTMGDTLDGNLNGEATPISVTVSGFYMDVNLVSYSQWQTVYNWATSHGYGFVHAGAGKAANHPVQRVDWYDCVKWCNARSQQAGLTPVYYTDAGFGTVYKTGETDAVYPNWSASGYRLPTEAEWEKAARGGTPGHRFPWSNVDTISESQANYFSNPGNPSYDAASTSGYNPFYDTGGLPYTSPVGAFASNANGYGLYDMAGNSFEWCWDWYGTPYAGGTDPHGPAAPNAYGWRVNRGGDWESPAYYARCANRSGDLPSDPPYIAFRCVRAH